MFEEAENDVDGVDEVEDDSLPEESAFVSATELEGYLEEKEYRKFREKLLLPDDLEESDDLEVMVKMCETKGDGNVGAKTLYKNLFDVLCCLAGESIDNTPMQASDQLLNFNIKFVFWVSNIELKEEFSSTLLRFFPNKKLPADFLTYCKAMSPVPTVKWIKDQKLQSKSPEKRFGLAHAMLEACPLQWGLPPHLQKRHLRLIRLGLCSPTLIGQLLDAHHKLTACCEK